MNWYPKRLLIVAGIAAIVGSGVVALADNGSPGNPSPLNDLPYGKLQSMASQGGMMTKMQGMMKQGVFLMGGQPTKTGNAKAVTLVGQIDDTNCYAAYGYYGHNHALCAKACILQGSPMTFLTNDGQAYAIISHADFVPISPSVYDAIGEPNLKVTGYVNERGGATALTIDTIDGKSVEMKKPMMM
ncbi:MAG: hypothetical protein ACREM2_08945 [Vulcanimicrobiaceae bacterium]